MNINIHCLKCSFDDFKLYLDPEGMVAKCDACDREVRLTPELIPADEFGLIYVIDEEPEKVKVILEYHTCPACDYKRGRRRAYGPDSVPRAYVYCPKCKKETQVSFD